MRLMQTTTKAGGMAATIAILLTQLPEPYASWVSYALMGVGILGLISTQIPAPDPKSKLWPVYKVMSFLAANWGAAVNYALMLRKGTDKIPPS